MKKFIYKTFITLSFICFFQVKTPIFHITQPSLMHHFDFVVHIMMLLQVSTPLIKFFLTYLYKYSRKNTILHNDLR